MLKLLLGDPNTRKLKRYQPIVEEINFLEEEISQLTDDELRTETHILKSKISSELDVKKQKVMMGFALGKREDASALPEELRNKEIPSPREELGDIWKLM